MHARDTRIEAEERCFVLVSLPSGDNVGDDRLTTEESFFPESAILVKFVSALEPRRIGCGSCPGSPPRDAGTRSNEAHN